MRARQRRNRSRKATERYAAQMDELAKRLGYADRFAVYADLDTKLYGTIAAVQFKLARTALGEAPR